VYAFAVFGTPIPLSASAKLSAARIPFPVGLAVNAYSVLAGMKLWFLALIFFLLGVLHLLVTRKIQPDFILVLLYGGIYFAVASFIAGSFPWYYAPLVPMASVLMAGGIEALSQIPFLASKLARMIKFTSLGLLILIQLGIWVQSYAAYQGQPYDTRYLAYRQVSDWLASHASPQHSLASFEIGYIGYFTNLKVIDLSGLVTPQVLPWVGSGPEESLSRCLKLCAPDFVLISADAPAQLAILKADPHYQFDLVFQNRYWLFEKKADL
jgi:hypothetical protein